VRIALLVIVLVACERSGTCEQRMKSRLNGDPRWRETSLRVGTLVDGCRDLDAGRSITPELRAQIECMLDAESDADAVDRCAPLMFQFHAR
jgi:hypothetical protein